MRVRREQAPACPLTAAAAAAARLSPAAGRSEPRVVRSPHSMPHGFSGCGSSHALLSPLSRTNEEPSLEVLSAIAGLDSLALGSSGDTDAAQPPLDCCGRYGLDFLRHPVAAYGHLPTPLRQLLALPTPLKRFTVAARPTIKPSGVQQGRVESLSCV